MQLRGRPAKRTEIVYVRVSKMAKRVLDREAKKFASKSEFINHLIRQYGTGK